jgi:transketolase
MVRTHLCYGGARVKLMATYAGISDSFDGPTHHSISDIAIMRSLPKMTIVVPGDTVALAKLLPQVAEWDGPVYFRMNRNEVPLLFDEATYQPVIGKAIVLQPGSDLTLIGTGLMVSRCLDASVILAKEGLSVRVLEIHTLKPLDSEKIIQAAEESGALVTAEEHNIIGGLGGAVAEVVAEACPVPVVRVGIADRFTESGPYMDLLNRYGLAVDDVVNAAHKALILKEKMHR